MLKILRKRMTYANVALTLALVFTMTGGAYAAKKYLITSTKQISPSVLKSLQGKSGPAGAQGPAGPAGPQGAAGKDGVSGAPGEKGKDGTEGTAGKDGVSVTSAQAVGTIEGTHCVGVGGSKFESASGKTYACNGKEGKEGKEGALGTAGTALPVGATETGSWLATIPAGQPGPARSAISFPVPLAASLSFSNVTVVQPGETAPSGCENPEHEGAASAENPEAASGRLCVFIAFQNGGAPLSSFFVAPSGSNSGSPGVSTSGAVVAFLRATEEKEKEEKEEPVGEAWLRGTFAVTG